MGEEQLSIDRPVESLVVRIEHISSTRLTAVLEDGELHAFSPEEAREIGKALRALASEIEPEAELLADGLFPLGPGSLRAKDGRWLKFTLLDLLSAVTFIGLGFAPIGALFNGVGPLAFLLFLSPALIGAGIGALYQRKWDGFNYGLLGLLAAIIVISFVSFFVFITMAIIAAVFR